jgi:hypothetical protein
MAGHKHTLASADLQVARVQVCRLERHYAHGHNRAPQYCLLLLQRHEVRIEDAKQTPAGQQHKMTEMMEHVAMPTIESEFYYLAVCDAG